MDEVLAAAMQRVIKAAMDDAYASARASLLPVRPFRGRSGANETVDAAFALYELGRARGAADVDDRARRQRLLKGAI